MSDPTARPGAYGPTRANPENEPYFVSPAKRREWETLQQERRTRLWLEAKAKSDAEATAKQAEVTAEIAAQKAIAEAQKGD